MWKRCWRPTRTAGLQARQRAQEKAQAQWQMPCTADQRALHSTCPQHSSSLGIHVRTTSPPSFGQPAGAGGGRGRRLASIPFSNRQGSATPLWLCPAHKTLVRNASIWSKIKPDPSKPFFARRSTKNTPNTVVILLRNANIPMMQKNPPVFMPTSADEVQHSLNTLLFMSDFNTEPKPMAFNVLACSSTGLIHYLQIANEHLSLILPVYFITDGGQNPSKLPPLLRTFLESPTYTKVGFGAFEDARRLKEQYGIDCMSLLDIQWMTRIMGIGTTHVGMLDRVFGDPHMPFIPGKVKDALPRAHPDELTGSFTPATRDREMRLSELGKEEQGGEEEVVDVRRWDWEAHGDMHWTPELIRCVAQDASVTLSMLGAIQKEQFRIGAGSPVSNLEELAQQAHKFLLSSIPCGTLVPMKSFHHLLKGGKFLSSKLGVVERDAQALAIVRHLVSTGLLMSDKTDQQAKVEFSHPSVLNRRVQLPGTQASVELMANSRTRRRLAELFGCRTDELRLMQDSNWARKPDKIQDLECFLGLYDWLELLPGALEPLDRRPTDMTSTAVEEIEIELEGRKDESPPPSPMVECGRHPTALLGLFLQFGALAEQTRQAPVETRRWAQQRMGRLLEQGLLVDSGASGLIRIHPTVLRRLKGIEASAEIGRSKNKDMQVAL
ncbi:hypothetical protein DFQ26_000164 [Actinomortierella ambigua]|nr:hypothetical protein DFQ26_000164 [Actinomortierella ambigua]